MRRRHATSSPRAPRATFSPLYRQVKTLLVQGLDSGEWKPGTMIPSEMELAARFQVSQGTVRKAIDELVAAHVLLRRQGKGTFVATHHEADVRYRFLRLASDQGVMQATQSRVLCCERVRASSAVARTLNLHVGAAVVALRRLLSFAERATVIDDIWLPGDVFRGLNSALLGRYRGPLYGLFETEFGVSMVRADEKLRAVAACAEYATLLKIAIGAPLLQVERVSYTYEDRPMELRCGHYLTADFHYRNSLT